MIRSDSQAYGPQRDSRRLPLTENMMLLAGLIIAVVVLSALPSVEPFVPLVFGFFAAAALGAKLLLGESLRFGNLTLPSGFFFAYILMIAVPSTYMFTQMDDPIRYTYLLALQSVLVTFPLGVALANCLFDDPSATIAGYCGSAVLATDGDLNVGGPLMFLMLGSLGAMGCFFLFSDHVPLMGVFLDYSATADALDLRFSCNELPKPVHYAFEITRRLALPLCVVYAFLMARHRPTPWRPRFWMLFALTLVIASLSLDRAPPIALFVMLLVATAVSMAAPAWKKRAIPAYALLIGCAILTGGVISMLQYGRTFNSKHVATHAWYVSTYRIFESPSYMASLAFKLFPGPEDFLYGTQTRMFSILPGVEYNESLDERIPLACAPVSFVGDLWRNWGWPGVIAGPVFIGFLMQCIQLTLFRQKTVRAATFHVVLLLGCIYLVPGNALGIITTSVVVFGALLGYLVILGFQAPEGTAPACAGENAELG